MIVSPRMSARTIRKMGRSGERFTGPPLTPEVALPGNPRSRRPESSGLQRLRQRVAELLQIVRLAAGDPVPVTDDRLVLHVRADLAEVLLDGLPGGQGAALHQAGGDQELRPVANGGQRLSRAVELLHEADESLVGPELVGGVAARKDQRVVLVRPDLVDRLGRLEGDFALVALELLARLAADDVD